MLVKVSYNCSNCSFHKKIDTVMSLAFEVIKDDLSSYGPFFLPGTLGIRIIRTVDVSQTGKK